MRLVVDGWLLAVPAAAWLEIIVDLIVKGVLLLGATHLAMRLLRRLPATLKTRVWTAVFALILVLPVVSGMSAIVGSTVSVGSWLTVIQQNRTPAMDPPSKVAATGKAVAERSSAGGAPSTTETSTWMHARPFAHWQIPAAAWLLGVLWFGIWTLRGLRTGRKVAAAAFPAPPSAAANLTREIGSALDITRRVTLRISPALKVPFVAGIFRPVLVLPAGYRDWTEHRLRLVLLHELVHVRCHDLARLALIDLACALHWFNPLAWQGARRAKIEIEKACDAAVCSDGFSASDYARQLVWFARRAAAAERVARMPGMAREPGLEERVRALLERRVHRSFGRIVAFGIPALVLALSLPVGAIRLVGQEQAAPIAGIDAPAAMSNPLPLTAGGGSIHEAAVAGEAERIDDLLAGNPDLLDARDAKGMTPLALAAWNDHIDLVEYLIERSADVDSRNNNGLTPLFCALDRTRIRMARLLLSSGADLETHGYRGRSLLHMATRAGSADMVRRLIERGADVNAVDVRGVTPLDLAAWKQDGEIAKLLASHGATRSDASPPVRRQKKRQA